MSINKTYKPKEMIRYTLNVEEKRISQAQAKTNEIKLKDIEIEINNPISMNIEDYLENINNIEMSVLKLLKLDTSLVNITQAGTYQYTITYNKKKYIGVIKKNLDYSRFFLFAIIFATNYLRFFFSLRYTKLSVLRGAFSEFKMLLCCFGLTTMCLFTPWPSLSVVTYLLFCNAVWMMRLS